MAPSADVAGVGTPKEATSAASNQNHINPSNLDASSLVNSNGNNSNGKKKQSKKPTKKSKEKSNNKAKMENNAKVLAEKEKTKVLVEELKLFQNHKLLNQQDPLQQLQQQLGQLMENEDTRDSKTNALSYQTNKQPLSSQQSNHPDGHSKSNQTLEQTSASNINQQQQEPCFVSLASQQPPFLSNEQHSNSNGLAINVGATESMSTIKKGVLWQQQQYEKFHQRLFSRWKKRYFVLTTDYLVCFKRSQSKVGRSEMGQFLYKTSLNEVTRVDWSKPKKSDKGAIIVHMLGNFNLFLWSKKNLDEWMFMLRESLDRYKIRKSCLIGQNLAVDCDKLVSTSLKLQIDDNNQLESLQKIQVESNHINNNNELREEFFSKIIKQENVDQVSSSDKKEANVSSVVSTGNKTCKELENPAINGNSAAQSGPNVVSTWDDQGSGSVRRNSACESIEEGSKREKEATKKQQQQQLAMINHASDSDTKGQSGNHSRSSFGSRSNAGSRSSSNSSGGRRAKINDNLLDVAESSLETANKPENSLKESRESSSKKTNLQAFVSTDLSPSHTSCLNPASSKPTSASKSSSSPTCSTLSNSTLSSAAKATGRDNAKVGSHHSSLEKSNENSSSRCSTSSSSSKTRGEFGSKEGRKNLVKSVKRKSSKEETNLAEVKFEQSELLKEVKEASTKNQLVEKTTSDHKNSSFAGALNDNSSIAIKDNKSNNKSLTNGSSGLVGSDRVSQVVCKSMMRRDESWQSLEALTRVGKVAPSMLAEQPLLTQDANNNTRHQNQFGGATNKQIISLIESNATPSRATRNHQLVRHQSIQSRNPPLFNQHQHPISVSFESPANSNPSYRQRLLQLQLMHNSNNVDYIRNTEQAQYNSQMYAESIANSNSNNYGYSSMRSNLKSAASEFSFIRPSPSGYIQSTLPHQPKQLQVARGNVVAARQPDQVNNLNRNSLLLLSGKTQQQFQFSNDLNNNDINVSCQPQQQQQQQSQQFLVHPVTGQKILGPQSLYQEGFLENLHHQQQQQELSPPLRELPMKPNKRRAPAENCVDSGKKSSLTSTISLFFRRAFSRSSSRPTKSSKSAADPTSLSSSSSSSWRKSKRKGKLNESCSSIGAIFADKSLMVPLSGGHSAFSTGSKSVLAGDKMTVGLQQERMVDMIEAFTSKHSNELLPDQSDQNKVDRKTEFERGNFQVKQAQECQQRSSFNKFSSPLHKSNSMSTTIGFSQQATFDDANPNNTKHQFLYENPGFLPQRVNEQQITNSPLLMRSTKVMSTNLTPLMTQKQPLNTPYNAISSQQQQQQQPATCFLVSPRVARRSDVSPMLPRPSSIYGQPSMISSPSMGAREMNSNNFGQHRNSMHNQHYQIRDNSELLRPRHHQMGVAGASNAFQHLDTTCEVAEELSSPVSGEQQMKHHLLASYNQRRDNSMSPDISSSNRHSISSSKTRANLENFPITSSPSSGKLQHYQHRQAVVNPILQSPTMDAIYDNHHPSIDINRVPTEANFSHYDNHNQFLMTNLEQPSPSIRTSASKGRLSSMHHQQFSNPVHPTNHYTNKNNQTKLISTPSRYSATRLNSDNRDWLFEGQNKTTTTTNNNNNKPSAIVAPSKHDNLQFTNSPLCSENFSERTTPQPLRSSPLMTRRTNNYHNYQPSPLVLSNFTQKPQVESVVNIAGAPGINLEPSLAASLLRGTNINAYETSTFDRNANSNQSHHSNQAFLVSTRLSKSIAQSELPNEDNNNATTNSRESSAEGSFGSSSSGSGQRNWINSKLQAHNNDDKYNSNY